MRGRAQLAAMVYQAMGLLADRQGTQGTHTATATVAAVVVNDRGSSGNSGRGGIDSSASKSVDYYSSYRPCNKFSPGLFSSPSDTRLSMLMRVQARGFF